VNAKSDVGVVVGAMGRIGKVTCVTIHWVVRVELLCTFSAFRAHSAKVVMEHSVGVCKIGTKNPVSRGTGLTQTPSWRLQQCKKLKNDKLFLSVDPPSS
jgi:hypothetical protein